MPRVTGPVRIIKRADFQAAPQSREEAELEQALARWRQTGERVGRAAERIGVLAVALLALDVGLRLLT